MQYLVFKKNISPSKIKALLNFLKSWGIEAELSSGSKIPKKKSTDFNLSVGIWENMDTTAEELRRNAWKRNT